VQEAIPERASLPENETATGWSYHPFVSGARAACGETSGGVASYRNERVCGAETFPALSVQVPVTEADAESGPE
jgi:hypothetical protein